MENRPLALVLAAMRESEDTAEMPVFEHTLSLINDKDIRAQVLEHMADERRHAGILDDWAHRFDPDVGVVPDKLVQGRMFHQAAGFHEVTEWTRETLVRAWGLAFALERRACIVLEQLSSHTPPPLSAVLLEIRKDEQRHLHNCNRVLQHLGAPEDLRSTMIAAEERSYKRVQLALAYHIKGLVTRPVPLDNVPQ